MYKIIIPNWSFGDIPQMEIIPMSSKGLVGMDKTAMLKRASARLLDKLASAETHPDEVLVHLIALGATEVYGPNRNGDGFGKEACKQYHPYFVKEARFYRNHENKDKAKSYGRVILSDYNDDMDRVELICGLNGTDKVAKLNKGLLADRELEKLANGQDIPVSMACILDPTYPVLVKDKGYIGIASVQVGDEVWTNESRWRKVTKTIERSYTGYAHSFNINGLPMPFELTHQHPMWGINFDSNSSQLVCRKATRYFADAEAFDENKPSWLHAEHFKVGDRFIYRAITQYTGYGSIDSLELAAIMGYYTAEGSLGFNTNKLGEKVPCTVQFACNMSDSLPRLLPKYMEELFPEVTVQIKPHRTSAVGLGLFVYNSDLAAFIWKYLGAGCRGKVIPPEIFNSSREVKLAYIGAYLDGDGWLDVKGIHWSTASQNLALQIRDLLATLDIPTSIYCIDHAKCATSGKENSGVEYTVNVAHIDAGHFIDYSEKAAKYGVTVSERKKPAAMRKCADGSYAYRIKETSKRYVYNTPVYNLEVEEDESYTLAGLVSHNSSVSHDLCSYCGNKAPNRSLYCEDFEKGGMCKAGGLKEHMGELRALPDGSMHMLHADNPEPHFFDISHVYVPADRTAYVTGTLTKAANAAAQLVSGAELAEIYGLYSNFSSDHSNLADMTKYARSLTYLCDAVDTFHKEQGWLKVGGVQAVATDTPLIKVAVARRYSSNHISRALCDANICLTPSQFVQLEYDVPFEEAIKVGQVIGPLSNDKFHDMLRYDTSANPYAPTSVVPERLRDWAEAQSLPHWTEAGFRKQSALNHLQGVAPRTVDLTNVYTLKDIEVIDTLSRKFAAYKAAYIGALPEDRQKAMSQLIVCRDYLTY